MALTRTSTARWEGGLEDGSGSFTVGDGVFSGDYSFASRFESGEGTNPEELLAAAHAACYSMALSDELGGAGFEPKSIETIATATLDLDGDPEITTIELEVVGDVPGIDEETFLEYAEAARVGCPVSQLFGGATLEVDAELS